MSYKPLTEFMNEVAPGHFDLNRLSAWLTSNEIIEIPDDELIKGQRVFWPHLGSAGGSTFIDAIHSEINRRAAKSQADSTWWIAVLAIVVACVGVLGTAAQVYMAYKKL